MYKEKDEQAFFSNYPNGLTLDHVLSGLARLAKLGLVSVESSYSMMSFTMNAYTIRDNKVRILE